MTSLYYMQLIFNVFIIIGLLIVNIRIDDLKKERSKECPSISADPDQYRSREQ